MTAQRAHARRLTGATGGTATAGNAGAGAANLGAGGANEGAGIATLGHACGRMKSSSASKSADRCWLQCMVFSVLEILVQVVRRQLAGRYPELRVLSRCRLMNVFGAGTHASSSDETDFSCQRIKLVGKRQLDTALQQELTFANHVHQFDAGQYTFGGSK